MNHDPAESPADNSAPGMPSEGLRTLLSFLLFVHLFALAVAISSNARPLSGLRNQLGHIPFLRPYLQVLHMDLAYNFHLTYALAEDTDQWIELRSAEDNANDLSGADSGRRMIFPERGIAPPVRRNRYRNLMLLTYLLAQGENAESLLPKQIATRLFHEQGITDGTYVANVRRRDLVSMEQAASSDADVRDPLNTPTYSVYEAELWFSRDGLELNKQASALETATVRDDQPEQPPDDDSRQESQP